ncbi:GlsB/YeaQ/YmgE family stress response membrane protein [Roseospira goensis]|uniref:Putative membrane protein YeaQ/YmgE (Transglycosylase-associated protein family) n=1 Tax=Roseospira goensis TaxID=391922 RepID=A0A7W6WK22_9PROT|nr:hypothetical protein [Roseospira goensis]MBB4284972.1 putative membrane protein YeaQ/YmgE (transglycosylase-associated protein family) [Roseospira goensis]
MENFMSEPKSGVKRAQQNNDIGERYEKALVNGIAVNPLFPNAAKQQMASLVEEIARSDENINTFLNWDTRSAQLGGHLAEEFHANTFNMDAINKDNAMRLETGLDNNLVPKNHEINDLVVNKDNIVARSAQSKYDKAPEVTAHDLSQLNFNNTAAKYSDVDVALVPSDQLSAVKAYSQKRSEDLLQKAQQLLESGAEPAEIATKKAEAEAYRLTAQKANDRIEHEGISSSPLSKKGANQLGDGNTSELDKFRSGYKTKSTLYQMKRSAASAAALSAIIVGTVNCSRYLKLVKDGKITTQEAVVKITGETAAASAASAINAAAVTGVHSTLVRVTGQQAVAPLARQTLGVMFRSNMVTVGAVCAVDAVKDVVLMAAGKITLEELGERQGRGIMTTSSGVVGGSIGAAAVGALTTTAALPLMAGGLVGGVIGAVAMNFAIEKGIDGPYREICADLETLQDSAQWLDQVSKEFFNGQVLFEEFLKESHDLDGKIQRMQSRARQSTAQMRASIDKI